MQVCVGICIPVPKTSPTTLPRTLLGPYVPVVALVVVRWRVMGMAYPSWAPHRWHCNTEKLSKTPRGKASKFGPLQRGTPLGGAGAGPSSPSHIQLQSILTTHHDPHLTGPLACRMSQSWARLHGRRVPSACTRSAA